MTLLTDMVVSEAEECFTNHKYPPPAPANIVMPSAPNYSKSEHFVRDFLARALILPPYSTI